MQYAHVSAFILGLTDDRDDPSEAAARAILNVRDTIGVV